MKSFGVADRMDVALKFDNLSPGQIRDLPIFNGIDFGEKAIVDFIDKLQIRVIIRRRRDPTTPTTQDELHLSADLIVQFYFDGNASECVISDAIEFIPARKELSMSWLWQMSSVIRLDCKLLGLDSSLK